VNLSKAEREDMVIALNIRCNIIETGDPHLSANDVAQRLKDRNTLFRERYGIKPLSVEQMKLIVRMKELVQKLYALNL
jgi:hypothetical protein